MILFDNRIKDWPYVFYNTSEDAEKQRQYLTKTEGKVVKVIILEDK